MKNWYEEQTHTHEIEASVMLAEEGDDRHNHRFAVVSGEAIPCGHSHIHKFWTNTDFFEEHFHEIKGMTDIAIEVGNGKHVHFATGMTTFNDGHRHNYQLATLIESPLTNSY